MPFELLAPEWQPLVRTIAAMVTLAPEHVVVQVYGDDGLHGGPYVQTLQEDKGATTLEAASNAFLDTPLSNGAIEILRSMGWHDPEPEIGLPNHYCMVAGESAASGDIAEFLVRTLRDAYGVETGMLWYRDDSDPRDEPS